MTHPNRNARWGHVLIEELAAAGLAGLCVSPGSRSTPLTVAASDHEDLRVFSHLDERSSAFFALGRARRLGAPVGLLCTSGTAAANYHPAVLEASNARVPLVVLTADRPPELRDSGANQTADQVKLYGDAVRWFRDLPEPDTTDRTLRRLRVDAARAVSTATGTPAGPVHLNVPFRKPLEPVAVPGDEPEDPDGVGATGRDGSFVESETGSRALPDAAVDRLADRIADASRVVLVAGPAGPPGAAPPSLADLGRITGAPILADPLSGARFGIPGASDSHDPPFVCGGFDAYLGTDAVEDWPEPDVVLRIGASPTSKPLRTYLAASDAHQVLIDPAGGWREAEFAVAEHVVADEAPTLAALTETLSDRGVDPKGRDRTDYRERFEAAERAHWSILEGSMERERLEGGVVPAVLDAMPDPSTLFASNSMPVRDVDRFARPDERSITVLANRGVSGIDGVTSTALGAASATDDPLVAIVGDLAFYHDMNGLLAAGRCEVDATIVLVNNDGGGIFHALPIEQFEPPFTEAFKTPHGLSFDPTEALYDLEFTRVDDLSALTETCRGAIGDGRLDVIEIAFDAEASHRTREALTAELDAALSADDSS